MINRRSLITGLISLVAAPAIVRVGSLMPVKAMVGSAPIIINGDSWGWGEAVVAIGRWRMITYGGHNGPEAIRHWREDGAFAGWLRSSSPTRDSERSP